MVLLALTSNLVWSQEQADEEDCNCTTTHELDRSLESLLEDSKLTDELEKYLASEPPSDYVDLTTESDDDDDDELDTENRVAKVGKRAKNGKSKVKSRAKQKSRKRHSKRRRRTRIPAPKMTRDLSKPESCSGYVCNFRQQCGEAAMNRLTPRGSQAGYIVNGEDSLPGEWPHYVRLSIHHGGGSMGVCGGVLISDRHVLTAGHCVVNPQTKQTISPNAMEVILADYNRDHKDPGEMTMRASHICRANGYSDTYATQNDWAVLTLPQNVAFSDNVRPACLPYEPIDTTKAMCFVVGMGVVSQRNQGQWKPILQKMRVTEVSCARSNWGISEQDRSRHCFTKFNAPGDSCGGDSGGPIICLGAHKRWTVVGLVSYGSVGCDGTSKVGWVGVYTRVPSLISDIQAQCLG